MVAFLTEHYSTKGRGFCADALGLNESQVRSKVRHLKLRLDHSSQFYQDCIQKTASARTGRKRPEQAAVMIRAIHSRGLHLHSDEVRKAVGAKTAERIAKNGHPRGALGMRHTGEMKAEASVRGKRTWANKTEEELDAHCKRASISGSANTMNRANASWKAAWREIGGINKYFRSRWEANYARYLEWLKERGEIKGWRHEPTTFWFEGIKRGCMSYLPDFEVTEMNGDMVYHEVKGWMDDRSVTKIKRMAKYHPKVKLLVIDSKAYRSIEKTMSRVILGWESK